MTPKRPVGLIFLVLFSCVAAANCGPDDLSKGVKKISASSQYPEQDGQTFNPEQAMDGNLQTAWIENQRGSGRGQWLKIQLKKPYDVQALEIVSGLQGQKEGVDLFGEYNRIKTIQVCVWNPKKACQDFELPDKREETRLAFEEEHKDVTSVRLALREVYPGNADINATAISEIKILGSEPLRPGTFRYNLALLFQYVLIILPVVLLVFLIVQSQRPAPEGAERSTLLQQLQALFRGDGIPSKSTDHWISVVYDLGAKAEDLRREFREKAGARDWSRVKQRKSMLTGTDVTSTEVREYEIFENDRGAFMVVRIAEHGKDLVLSWDLWIRPRINWKFILRILFLAGLGGFGFAAFMSFDPEGDWLKGFLFFVPYWLSSGTVFLWATLIIIALPLMAAVARYGSLPGWSLIESLRASSLIKPVTLFDRDDNIAMSAAVHKTLMQASKDSGIDQKELNIKEEFNGGREDISKPARPRQRLI